MYQLIRVNSIDSLSEITAEKLFVFVECKLETDILIRLVELAEDHQLKVYYIKSNFFSDFDPIAEQNIIFECFKANLEYEPENYDEYHLYNSDLDSYVEFNSNINDIADLTILKWRDKLHADEYQEFIDIKWLVPNNNGKFVVEEYVKMTKALKDDVYKLFNFIGADHIAITTDSEKYFTCDNNLSDQDLLVAKSNNLVDNKYFFIPESNDYIAPKKFVLISDYQFKFAFNNLMNGDYIIGFKDNLRYSNYFTSSCQDFKVTTSTDLGWEPQPLYSNQDIESLALIRLVNTNYKVEVYDVVNNQLHYHGLVIKDSSEFKNFVLDYKNTLVNRYEKSINLEVLFGK